MHVIVRACVSACVREFRDRMDRTHTDFVDFDAVVQACACATRMRTFSESRCCIHQSSRGSSEGRGHPLQLRHPTAYTRHVGFALTLLIKYVRQGSLCPTDAHTPLRYDLIQPTLAVKVVGALVVCSLDRCVALIGARSSPMMYASFQVLQHTRQRAQASSATAALLHRAFDRD